ncbi:MAG: hypothetical protein K0S34_41 [Bacillales bacterium]|jgi:hypothetical protein|nr:hypothetical protein [Bacillales bacterium]
MYGLKNLILDYKKIFWIKKTYLRIKKTYLRIKKLIFWINNSIFGLNLKRKLAITKFSLVKIYVNVYKDKI